MVINLRFGSITVTVFLFLFFYQAVKRTRSWCGISYAQERRGRRATKGKIREKKEQRRDPVAVAGEEEGRALCEQEN